LDHDQNLQMVDDIHDDAYVYGDVGIPLDPSFPLDHDQNLQMVDGIHDDAYAYGDVGIPLDPSFPLDHDQNLQMVDDIHDDDDVYDDVGIPSYHNQIFRNVVDIPFPFLHDNDEDDGVASNPLDHDQIRAFQSVVGIHLPIHHPIRDAMVHDQNLQMVDISCPFLHDNDDVLVANNPSLDHDQNL